MNRARALLTFGLLIGTACGSNADSEANRTLATTEQVVATLDAPPSTQDAEVPEALRFRAPLVGGGETDVSTLAGKPVVLWFWAPY